MITRLFRWTAIVPLSLLLLLLVVLWLLYVDRFVQHTVEDYGADLVGARVDVERADLRLGEGRVSLSGLAVANPDSPMRNLLEAREVVADIRMQPLLTKKLVVQEIAIRGLRFGTERSTSGALDPPNPSSGRLMREIAEWREALRIPPLNLGSLGKVINVAGIAADSLESIRLARATLAFADSARREWESRLVALNPAPTIDTARVLIDRLQSANPLRLGVTGTAQLITSSRQVLTGMTQLRSGLAQLDSSVQSGLQTLGGTVRQFDAARDRDYRYARSLLRLPSFEAPDLSLAIFGEAAAARLTSVLYWFRRAEDVLPPGLQPRRFLGPKRARRPGTTVTFPKPGEYPRFLLEQAEFDFSLEGAGAAAGNYVGSLAGVTTAPALYGRPMVATVAKSGGPASVGNVTVRAVVDHTGSVVRDSLRAVIERIQLPVLTLPRIGVQLALGQGTNQLSLQREAGRLSGHWMWKSDEISWTRLTTGDSLVVQGVEPRIRDLLWRTVSSVRTADIDIGISGSVSRPELDIRSNVGREIVQSFRAELGREIARAEREVRAEVDRLVAPRVAEVRQRVANIEGDIAQRIGVDRERVAELRGELEVALRRWAMR